MSFTDEQDEHIQNVIGAIISATPSEFKTIDCSVRQVENHCAGRYEYRITCAEFPDEAITEPTVELHEAAYLAMNELKADELEISMEEKETGWSFSVKTSSVDAVNAEEIREQADEQLWQQVYSEREAFMVEQFGELPEDINKVMTVHWTGGGVFDLKQSKIPGARVMFTCGLSNPDVPAPARVAEFQRTDEEDGVSYSIQLEPKVPRYVPPEWAGFGYEVAIVLTDKSEDRVMGALMWVVESELNEDANFFGTIWNNDGMTVQDLQLFDGSKHDFLFYPSMINWPSSVELSNGIMHLVIATRITREERDYAVEYSCEELIKRLRADGINQFSDFKRPSVKLSS